MNCACKRGSIRQSTARTQLLLTEPLLTNVRYLIAVHSHGLDRPACQDENPSKTTSGMRQGTLFSDTSSMPPIDAENAANVRDALLLFAVNLSEKRTKW